MELSLPAYGNLLKLTQTIQVQTGIDCQVNPCYPNFAVKLGGSHWWGYSVDLRAGLTLSVVEADFQKSFYLVADAQDCSVLRFNFCLSGRFRGRFEPSTDELLVTAGQSYLGALSGQIKLVSEFAATQKLLLVRIDVDPLLFKFLIGQRFEALSPDVKNILTGDQSGCCWQGSPISSAGKIILYQILNCPYQDTIRQLYLEGKVLELMALQFSQFTEKNQLMPPSRHLKPSDIERIHHAKHILINNLVNPPSLNDLARQVSINDFKLKHGFRQVFGTTVFGYLHQHRMEHAQLLLKSQDMNVTQVAQAVGYSNPSQFSAAFKKKFGVTPKVFQSS